MNERKIFGLSELYANICSTAAERKYEIIKNECMDRWMNDM